MIYLFFSSIPLKPDVELPKYVVLVIRKYGNLAQRQRPVKRSPSFLWTSLDNTVKVKYSQATGFGKKLQKIYLKCLKNPYVYRFSWLRLCIKIFFVFKNDFVKMLQTLTTGVSLHTFWFTSFYFLMISCASLTLPLSQIARLSIS